MGLQLHLPALEDSFFSLGHLFSRNFCNLVLVACNELPSNVVPRICLCLILAGTRASPGTFVYILHLSAILILTYQNLEVDEVPRSYKACLGAELPGTGSRRSRTVLNWMGTQHLCGLSHSLRKPLARTPEESESRVRGKVSWLHFLYYFLIYFYITCQNAGEERWEESGTQLYRG